MSVSDADGFEPLDREIATLISEACQDEHHKACRGIFQVVGLPVHLGQTALCICPCHLAPTVKNLGLN
jgi:hypothetical protein